MNVESEINPQSQSIKPQENGILLTCQTKTEDSLSQILRKGIVDPQETIGSRPFSLITLSAKKNGSPKTNKYHIYNFV
jgi:hypothetical protein